MNGLRSGTLYANPDLDHFFYAKSVNLYCLNSEDNSLRKIMVEDFKLNIHKIDMNKVKYKYCKLCKDIVADTIAHKRVHTGCRHSINRCVCK